MDQEYQDRLKDISEIRNLMEESTRFMSLSGLSGVSAGVVALFGAAGTYKYLKSVDIYDKLQLGETFLPSYSQLGELIGIALLILFFACASASIFTIRKARKSGKKIWTQASKRMGINLLIPLVTGAIFCIEMAWFGHPGHVAPATLIFYGLALLNAGKYTFREIRYLGISEIVLGLIAGFIKGYGIIFWAVGFGVLHIVYGTVMYLKYER